MKRGAEPADVIPTGGEALVARLLAAIGDGSPEEAVHVLAPDVVCHMDGFTARGVDAWIDWVEFIRAQGVENVKAEVTRFETGADGIITAFGGLTAGPGGKSAPGEGSARYRVAAGCIVEIWTSRWNYEIIFGPKVRHPLRWLLVLVRMALWRRLSRRNAPRSHPVPEESSFDGGGNESRRGSSPDAHPQR